MSKKLLFIFAAYPDYMPYVYNYLSLADECGVEYDVVCWNRRGDKTEFPANYTIYNHPTRNDYSPLKKLIEIWGFSRFVRKLAKGNHYHAIYTYTIADSIFFSFWLSRKYRGRYVFDIRDHSPLINFAPTKYLVERLLRHSALNVISSDGFKRWLPKGFDYILCHNTDIKKVREAIDKYENKGSEIKILTIGSLRDEESNLDVIRGLKDYSDIHLEFVGDGSALGVLQNYCEEQNVTNVHFYGRYKKEEEDTFVKACDMMNVVLPRNQVSDYLMSNRFYLSVRFRKPMIVNDGCYQAEVVNKYGLGLVTGGGNLHDEIVNYWQLLDWAEYNENCKRFLYDIESDMKAFVDVASQTMKDDMPRRGGYILLTIGVLRDFESNTRVIDSFANKEHVTLRFAGSGSKLFADYCRMNNIDNVLITDSYKKDDEDDIVNSADMINLFLPHTLNSDSCMGNRMYLAARMRKPVIVTSNSYQAQVVQKYHLGVCVDWDDNLYDVIDNYWRQMDWHQFDEGCNTFLKEVYGDMNTWNTMNLIIIKS